MCVCLTREGVEIHLHNEFVCVLLLSLRLSLFLFFSHFVFSPRLFPLSSLPCVCLSVLPSDVSCVCVSLCVSCARVHVCLCVWMCVSLYGGCVVCVGVSGVIDEMLSDTSVNTSTTDDIYFGVRFVCDFGVRFWIRLISVLLISV